MSYRVTVLPPAAAAIGRWGLSVEVLTEVFLRLRDALPADPTGVMVPAADPGGGMLYPFELVDPENRLVQHTFVFRVYYHPNEAELLVASGLYRRQFGF